MNLKSKQSGFSLIELLVSTALFTLIMISAMSIFNMVLKDQRTALAVQNVQESLKYFLEMTGKEIRMAQRNNGGCSGIPNNQIYLVSSSTYSDMLSFKNYHKQCVSYYLSNDNGVKRFTINRDGISDYASPDSININNLSFLLRPEGGLNNYQPAITVDFIAQAVGLTASSSLIQIQTTLTSRYYKTD